MVPDEPAMFPSFRDFPPDEVQNLVDKFEEGYSGLMQEWRSLELRAHLRLGPDKDLIKEIHRTVREFLSQEWNPPTEDHITSMWLAMRNNIIKSG